MSLEDYPCGCQYEEKPEGGFIHYIKSGCKFDDRPHWPIENYEYKSWGERLQKGRATISPAPHVSNK